MTGFAVSVKGFPGYGVYSASKAALRLPNASFNEAVPLGEITEQYFTHLRPEYRAVRCLRFRSWRCRCSTMADRSS